MKFQLGNQFRNSNHNGNQNSKLPMFSRPVFILLLLACLSGCGTVGYYSQIVSGHMRIVMGKRPVADIVSDETVSEKFKRRLQVAQDARQFGIEQLNLPNNNSYTSFYDTGKRYVTWNVVAAPEFSFNPHTWCFPVAGCVSYRGYYAEEDAQQYADRLGDEGLDVTVTGATAYSTLGWFKDPLLNTMLARSDPAIASLLFHELAHQKMYVGDDSTFNESFASFVESEGLKRWQENQKRVNPEQDHARLSAELTLRKQRQKDFIALLSETKDDLQEIYTSDDQPEQMRQRKRERFEKLRRQYDTLKSDWGGYNGYDGWFGRELNNARLVSIATYNDYVPAFAELFRQSENSFEKFYLAAQELAELPSDDRTAAMQELLAQSSVVSQ